MKLKEISLSFILFFLISSLFFYKIFIHGHVPFPGDLLLSEYNPWKTYSYFGYAPGGIPNKGQYFDVMRQIYPWKTLSIFLLKQGQIPLWNPYNFSGTPLLANFQSAVFYPLGIFYFILPQIISWSVLVFLQPLLASFFTYLFARKIGISKTGSVFSAVSYAFSSFMTVWLEYNTLGQVVLWLPIILFSVEKLLEKVKTVWMILLVFSVVSALFAGHPQVFIYLFFFSFIYCLYRIYTDQENKQKKKTFLFFAFLFFVALGIGAVQIFPGMELIQLSARSAHTYSEIVSKILIQPWQLVMLFVPDFFGNPATRTFWLADTYIGDLAGIGLVPLFFIPFTFLKRKNSLVRFFLISAIVILTLTTVNPLTGILYKFQIPFVSSSAPTLGIFIFCFSLSILTGFGIDIFKKEKKTLRRFSLLAISFFLLFIVFWMIVLLEPKLGFLQGTEHAKIAMRALLYESAVFVLSFILLFLSFKKQKLLPVLLVLILGLHLFDSWRAFEKFNPFVPKASVFPSANVLSFLKNHGGIDRFWGFGSSSIEANFATEYSLFSPNGYDPLYPKRYGEFLNSSQDGRLLTGFTDQTRSDAVISPASSNDFYTNFSRQRVLQVLGVRYITDRLENNSTEKTFPPEIFKNVYDQNSWKIYKNENALPRAFITSDYKIFHSNKEFESIFFNKNFNPGKTILLDRSLTGVLTATKSDVVLKSYSPNNINFDTVTNGSGLLFLSDTYYPGWEAFVDGKETQVYQADYDFRAVVVPKGNHQVSFTFSSASFKIGITVSLLCLIIIVAWCFYVYINGLTKFYDKK